MKHHLRKLLRRFPRFKRAVQRLLYVTFAVFEIVRVALRFAILHRTPVVIGRPDAHYSKKVA